MNITYDHFQDKFVEEATEHIHNLEKSLLELELSPRNQELIEKIFRAMHSLKGGGAMFGFTKLSEFTHILENVYEKVRSGTLPITTELLSLTFDAVDLLRSLLDLNIAGNSQLDEQTQKINQAIGRVLTTIHPENSNSPRKDIVPKTAGTSTYYIHFYPNTHVAKYGTNLLYLLDEISSLGQFYAIAGTNEVPEIDALSGENSYLYWDMFLATEHSVSEIQDIFIFVENDSNIEIQKISNTDLLANEDFSAKLKLLNDHSNDFALSDISDLIKTLEDREKTSPQEHNGSSAKEENYNRSNSVIRVSATKIDSLMNLVSEMVITQERLNMITARHHIPELKMVAENIQKLTGALRDSAFSISLIPLESLTIRFQRLIRDLSNDLGKEIRFISSGTDTELDKTMIESLSDPLLHIIRNSVDHGIESTSERLRKGKPEAGTIKFEAGYSGANVVIQIKDDGRGINPESIRKKAIEKGIIKADSTLSEQEILDMVFLPGFSTASAITEISGRGVGMDVVKRNIAAIRGEVAIESVPERGTTITITLPLVLSIIDGLLVKIAQTNYVIPLSLTDRIYPVSGKQLENKFIDVITLDEKQYPFINLRQELEINGKIPDRCQMVVVKINGAQYALSVDSVVGKIQSVLKPLGRLYHNQKMISAATIMGDGTISLVLDPEKLTQAAFPNARQIRN